MVVSKQSGVQTVGVCSTLFGYGGVDGSHAIVNMPYPGRMHTDQKGGAGANRVGEATPKRPCRLRLDSLSISPPSWLHHQFTPVMSMVRLFGTVIDSDILSQLMRLAYPLSSVIPFMTVAMYAIRTGRFAQRKYSRILGQMTA